MGDATRDTILNAIREARLHRSRRTAETGDGDELDAVDVRLRERPTGPRPELLTAGTPPNDPQAARLAIFMERLAAAEASCVRVRDAEAAMAAMTDYLDGHHLSAPPLAAEHPALRALPWPAGREPRFGMAAGDTPAGLTVATLGIAETGSVVLYSAPESPTGMNFLPDILICLLASDAVVDHLEDAWARLREQGPLPRAVNLVTGPSRTADVEQTLQLGAHGPRHLLIVLSDQGLAPAE